jgi:hypothetical protein
VKFAVSAPREVPDLAVDRRIGSYRFSVDSDHAVLNADGIELERFDLPTTRDLAVVESEARQMSWTDQAAAFDAPLRKVGFLVRTGALEGADPVAVACHDEAVPLDRHAHERTAVQMVQRCDDDKLGLAFHGASILPDRALR